MPYLHLFRTWHAIMILTVHCNNNNNDKAPASNTDSGPKVKKTQSGLLPIKLFPTQTNIKNYKAVESVFFHCKHSN